jgi:hypothetical protein
MPLFLHLFFLYTVDTFIHNSFIHKHSLRPISISSQLSAQWAEPPWGAEPRFELGPALQQASALPTEPHCTRAIDPHPLSTQRLCPPPASKAGVGRVHTRRAVRGWGGQYFGRHWIGLLQYNPSTESCIFIIVLALQPENIIGYLNFLKDSDS